MHSSQRVSLMGQTPLVLIVLENQGNYTNPIHQRMTAGASKGHACFTFKHFTQNIEISHVFFHTFEHIKVILVSCLYTGHILSSSGQPFVDCISWNDHLPNEVNLGLLLQHYLDISLWCCAGFMCCGLHSENRLWLEISLILMSATPTLPLDCSGKTFSWHGNYQKIL